MIDSVLQDFRYAFRRLRNAPGFAIVVVLTLALGIGATAATFSVVDAAVLRPLPFPGPDALVRLREVTPQGEPFSLSEPDYLDYARSVRSLAAVGAMKPVQLTLTETGDAIRLDGAAVSSTVSTVLGMRPALGASSSCRPKTSMVVREPWSCSVARCGSADSAAIPARSGA